MGLGKTLQTIAFLGYLKYVENKPNFHLIIVPRTTLSNWAREFAKWVPGFNVVVLTGDPDERRALLEDRILSGDFDVLITTYELAMREKTSLMRVSWEYLVIDEAHRIKNVDTLLSRAVRLFDTRNRLLITGTPLQNDLQELWALLNFIMPDIFSSAEDFTNWLGGEKNDEDLADNCEPPQDTAENGKGQLENKAHDATIVQQLHQVLRPFLLRRLKADVEKTLLPKKEVNLYVGLTEMQRNWYRALLKNDLHTLMGPSRYIKKSRLNNIVAQLRKCCNHPYLFDGAEAEVISSKSWDGTDQHLIENSAKMVVLDQLLARAKAEGSRVLIFSQMSRMLDIISDYCVYRQYEYSQLDGSVSHEERVAAIDEFNAPNSDKFVFLLTTRAGGMGINLTAANVVVLFDSDWNPQMDLQAMARAHRIGQTKQVYVYRLVTEHSIEERVIERAARKLHLNQLVIQQAGQGSQSQSNTKSGVQVDKDELVRAIQHGAEKILGSDAANVTAQSGTGGKSLEDMISEGERRTHALHDRFAHVGIDVLTSLDNPNGRGDKEEYAEDAQDQAALRAFAEKTARQDPDDEDVDKRRRAQRKNINYAETRGYESSDEEQQARYAGSLEELEHLLRRDVFFRFWPDQLYVLAEKFEASSLRRAGVRPPSSRDLREGETWEDMESWQAKTRRLVSSALPLTNKEERDMNLLQQQVRKELGPDAWTREEFDAYVQAASRHGQEDVTAITEAVQAAGASLPGPRSRRTKQQVQAYGRVLLLKGPQVVPDWPVIERKMAEAGVGKAMARYLQEASPGDKLRLTIKTNESSCVAGFQMEHDHWLLGRAVHHSLQKVLREGGTAPVHRDIRADPETRWDLWLHSRTVEEITSRIRSLYANWRSIYFGEGRY